MRWRRGVALWDDLFHFGQAACCTSRAGQPAIEAVVEGCKVVLSSRVASSALPHQASTSTLSSLNPAPQALKLLTGHSFQHSSQQYRWLHACTAACQARGNRGEMESSWAAWMEQLQERRPPDPGSSTRQTSGSSRGSGERASRAGGREQEGRAGGRGGGVRAGTEEEQAAPLGQIKRGAKWTRHRNFRERYVQPRQPEGFSKFDSRDFVLRQRIYHKSQKEGPDSAREQGGESGPSVQGPQRRAGGYQGQRGGGAASAPAAHGAGGRAWLDDTMDQQQATGALGAGLLTLEPGAGRGAALDEVGTGWAAAAGATDQAAASLQQGDGQQQQEQHAAVQREASPALGAPGTGPQADGPALLRPRFDSSHVPITYAGNPPMLRHEYAALNAIRNCRSLDELASVIGDPSLHDALQNPLLLTLALGLCGELAGGRAGAGAGAGGAGRHAPRGGPQAAAQQLQDRLVDMLGGAVQRYRPHTSHEASAAHADTGALPRPQPSYVQQAMDARMCIAVLLSLVKANRFEGLLADLLGDFTQDDCTRLLVLDALLLQQLLWCVSRASERWPQGSMPRGVMDVLRPNLSAAAWRHLNNGTHTGRWLSQVAWALGTIRYPDEAVVGRLVEIIKPRLNAQLTRREAARGSSRPGAGWGATLGRHDMDFSDVDLAALSIGLARSRFYDEQLMTSIGSLLLSMASDGFTLISNQAWSNYVVACSQLLHYNAEFMTAAAKHLASIIRQPSTAFQVINNAIHAYAVFKHWDGELVEAVAQRLTARARDLNAQAISVTCWSLAVLGHSASDQLIDATSRQMQDLIDQGDDKEVRHKSSYAYSVLCIAPHRVEVLSQMLQQCSQTLRSMEESGRVAAALKFLETQGVQTRGLQDGQAYDDLPSLDRGSHGERAKLKEVVQFTRVMFQVHLELVDRGVPELGLPDAHRDICLTFWNMFNQAPVHTPAHDDVVATMKAMGLSVRSEMLSDDKCIRTDILLQHPQWGRVAVEVDGPFHFFTNYGDRFHGKANVRNRYLERRFDKVISINLDKDWSPLCDSELRKRQFMLRLLGLEE